MEEEIAANEEKVKELEGLANTEEYATDYVKAMELTSQIEELKNKNDMLYEEWMENS